MASTSSPDAARLAADADLLTRRLLADPDAAVGSELASALLSAGVLALARAAGGDPGRRAFDPGRELGATEAAIAACALLDAAGLETFELSMWRAWGSGPPDAETGR